MTQLIKDIEKYVNFCNLLFYTIKL